MAEGFLRRLGQHHVLAQHETLHRAVIVVRGATGEVTREIERLTGCAVSVRGALGVDDLHVGSLRAIDPSEVLDADPHSNGLRIAPTPDPIPLRAPDERMLLEEGALLSTWTEIDDRGLEVPYALAADPDRVAEVLTRPGVPLRIVASGHTCDELDTVSAEVQAVSDAVGSFGYRLTPDRQLQVQVQLIHLSSRVAEAMAPRAGALDIGVILRPDTEVG